MKTSLQYRILFFSLALLSLQCSNDRSESLTVAIAANAHAPFAEINLAFTEQTGVEVNTVVGSSGKLTAQIVQGAPFDVFISADLKYPKFLDSLGLTQSDPQVYAYGKLVYWTIDPTVNLDSLDLKNKHPKRLAIANPKTAPYGRAALALLQNTKVLESLKSRVVYGESIGQTNQFLLTGNVDLAITAKSTAIASGVGKWLDIDTTLYPPIEQGLVLIKSNNSTPVIMEKYAKFVQSDQSIGILQKFGYFVPPR